MAGHGIDHVVGADDERNMERSRTRVDLIEIGDQVVRDTRCREQDVMYPGMRPVTGSMANFTVTLRSGSN